MLRSMATRLEAACAISAAAISRATASPSLAEPSCRRCVSSGTGAAPKMAGLDDLLLDAASICKTDSLMLSHWSSGICICTKYDHHKGIQEDKNNAYMKKRLIYSNRQASDCQKLQ